jgi:hypothetical protein
VIVLNGLIRHATLVALVSIACLLSFAQVGNAAPAGASAADPTIEIAISPGNPSSSRLPQLSFSLATEPDDPEPVDVEFTCGLEEPTEDCSSGSWSPVSDLADGSYTFAVNAHVTFDDDSEADVRRDFEFEVDAPPRVEVTSPTSDVTNGWHLTFAYEADDPADFECRLERLGDDAPATGYQPCPSSGDGTRGEVTYSFLEEGTYRFSVRATDGTGNVGEEASKTITVDRTGPTTAITSEAPGTIAPGTVSFTFASEDAVLFECRLAPGDADFEPCVSGKTYDVEAAGEYTFAVRGRDRAGNVGDTASQTFKVELPPTPTPTPTATASPTPTATPSATPTATPTAQPSQFATPTPAPPPPAKVKVSIGTPTIAAGWGQLRGAPIVASPPNTSLKARVTFTSDQARPGARFKLSGLSAFGPARVSGGTLRKNGELTIDLPAGTHTITVTGKTKAKRGRLNLAITPQQGTPADDARLSLPALEPSIRFTTIKGLSRSRSKIDITGTVGLPACRGALVVQARQSVVPRWSSTGDRATLSEVSNRCEFRVSIRFRKGFAKDAATYKCANPRSKEVDFLVRFRLPGLGKDRWSKPGQASTKCAR